MTISLPEVPKGWKVYILGWFWLGIAVGWGSESTALTFVVWAGGASAGWLFASRVRDFGWKNAGAPVLRYVVVPAVACASLWLLVAGIDGATEDRIGYLGGAALAGISARMLWNRRWLNSRWLMLPLVVSFIVSHAGSLNVLNVTDRNAVLIGLLASGAVVLVGLFIQDVLRKKAGPHQSQPWQDDSRYRCPQCDKPTAVRTAYDALRCQACHHTFSWSNGSSSGQRRTDADRPTAMQTANAPRAAVLSRSVGASPDPAVTGMNDLEELRTVASNDSAAESLLIERPLDSSRKTSADTLAGQRKEAPVIKLLNVVLLSAIQKGATEIHIEPLEKHLSVRYRIDGLLNDVMQPPLRFREAIPSRIKEMAKLDATQTASQQNGRIRLRFQDNRMTKEIDIDVSCIPTGFGENIVMNLGPIEDKTDSLETRDFEPPFDQEGMITAAALAKQGEEAPVVKLVNVILMSAIEKGASDIHIEPTANELFVRYRIDGVLYDSMQPPLKFRDAILSCVKQMAGLDTAKRSHQQGRIDAELVGGQRVGVIVSCQPTRFGEDIRMSLTACRRDLPPIESPARARGLVVIPFPVRVPPKLEPPTVHATSIRRVSNLTRTNSVVLRRPATATQFGIAEIWPILAWRALDAKLR